MTVSCTLHAYKHSRQPDRQSRLVAGSATNQPMRANFDRETGVQPGESPDETAMRPLDHFCQLQLDRYEGPHSASPEAMAQDWIVHSGLSLLPSLSEIRRQMERYGLSLQRATIPDLRAHHYCYRGGDPTIIYEEGDWRGAVEFTLLHEFYEIILEQLERLSACCQPGSQSRICWHANRFAAAVLMQKDIFLQALFDSHFDVVWLHRHFYRSYSAIVIRAVELLNQSPAGPELACFIYQPDGNPRDGEKTVQDFRVACAASTPAMRRYPRGLLPGRKDSIAAGSIVDLALRTGQPAFSNSATGLGLEGNQNLTLLARPINWFRRPAKVSLQAMQMKDGHILEAQARRLDALMVNEPAPL